MNTMGRIVLCSVVAALACLFVTPRLAHAADRGRVIGKVLASDTGEPVGYADLMLVPADTTVGKRSGAFSNADGTFQLEAEPGVYSLQVRALSYSKKLVVGIVVVAGQTKDVSVSIAPEALVLKDGGVEVEAKAVQNTEAAMLAARKRSASVGDAVSSEQVKKSPDRDAGDVLRRVTGTSLQDGKFVFVRGMGERYSSTEMDGVRLASPEQNKRVVPLDMIPSTLLDNVVVQKTYTADRPGEFGGGDVQIKTKDFPGKRTIAASIGSAYDSQTSLNAVLGYQGSNGDRWAFGAGSRSLPDAINLLGGMRVSPGAERYPYDSLATIGASFKNQWSPEKQSGKLPGNFLVSYGDQLPVFGRALGIVASVGSNHSQTRTNGEEKFFEGSATNLIYDYTSETYTKSTLFSMLAGVSYRISPAHSLTLKGTQSRSADDETRTYSGINSSQSSNFDVSRLRYLERVISTVALDGRHDLPDLHGAKLAWTASLTGATRSEPDRREVYYRQSVDETGTPYEPMYFYRASRDFGDLQDDGRGLDAKMTVPFVLPGSRPLKLDVGGSLQSKDRDATYRRFDFGNNAFDIDPQAAAESLFKDGEWSAVGNRAYLNETTQPEDSYKAKQGVDGFFASADVAVMPELRAILGTRVEHGTQHVTTYDLFSRATAAQADLDDWDVLPTVNLVYTLDPRSNIRLAAARTLSRPDLRELTPGRTLNFFSGYQDIGNPDLERSVIWNYDARYETYPGLSEVLAGGVFFKSFEQPIEKQIVTGGSDRLLQPQNSDHGTNVGVELEARGSLGRIDKRLDNLFLNANGSLISSNIKLKEQTTLTTNPEHPLAGQANYLANVGLGYTSPGRFDVTFLVAAVGRRLYALGLAPVTEDIYQEPTTTLDAVVNFRPMAGWNVKFAGKNLTQADEIQKQGDVVVERKDSSRTFSLGVSFGQ